jgi:hypothetical protein
MDGPAGLRGPLEPSINLTRTHPRGVDGSRGVTGVLYYRQPPKEGCWINWIHEVIHLIQRCHCYVRKIVPCQPRAQLLPHSNGQALVRPSFYQPLVPVSVRRRSAACV